MSKYYLPSKIQSYLKRLAAEYASSERSLFADILQTGRVHVIEETSYDNWNGGTTGHDVKFFLPGSVLQRIKVREQKAVADEILKDLNICSESVPGEFFETVIFEINDEEDAEFQQAAPLSKRPQIDLDKIAFWRPGLIRLFISHRDKYKVQAKSLAESLEDYGISAFVAHDTIEPMATWQNEILKGLETMDVLLAFVTDDFHESTWTNQEIGFALGRDVPIISLKLQKTDPDGFLGSTQALRGKLDNAAAKSLTIYNLIAQKLGKGSRLNGALISAFVQSCSFDEAKLRFNRISNAVSKLSDKETDMIIQGFEENSQLHESYYLTNNYNRLVSFLERTTGRKYKLKGKTISPHNEKIDDEMPF